MAGSHTYHGGIAYQRLIQRSGPDPDVTSGGGRAAPVRTLSMPAWDLQGWAASIHGPPGHTTEEVHEGALTASITNPLAQLQPRSCSGSQQPSGDGRSVAQSAAGAADCEGSHRGQRGSASREASRHGANAQPLAVIPAGRDAAALISVTHGSNDGRSLAASAADALECNWSWRGQAHISSQGGSRHGTRPHPPSVVQPAGNSGVVTNVTHVGNDGGVLLVVDTQGRADYAPDSARAWLWTYFHKWKGVSGEKPPPRDTLSHIAWTWVGATVSIMAIALINKYVSPNISLPILVASFGASAVLLFGLPDAKLSQPRNFLGGHILSALVGMSVRAVFPDHLSWLSAALGMATALSVMQLTRTTHPPGGATALIAASATTLGAWHGFKFLLTILFACAVMLLSALVVNNISRTRRYPMYWF